MAKNKWIEERDQISALAKVKMALATALLDTRQSTQELTADFTSSLLIEHFPRFCPLIYHGYLFLTCFTENCNISKFW